MHECIEDERVIRTGEYPRERVLIGWDLSIVTGSVDLSDFRDFSVTALSEMKRPQPLLSEPEG